MWPRCPGARPGRTRSEAAALPAPETVLIWLGIAGFHMLVGERLIAFVRDNEELNQMELAKGAGYVRLTKTGKEQILVKQFYNALLAAKGMPISVGKLPGKAAQYETTVHKNGVILLGKTYSEKFGLKPGDALQILVEDEAIRLVPVPVVPDTVSTAALKRVAKV